MSKRHAPAALRNRDPIREVLAQELGDCGLLLEVASGSGEHALYLSSAFPHWQWQPSDPDPVALESIAAWRAEQGGANLLAPIELDAVEGQWPVARADAIVCINMTHISPRSATEGLFAAAGRLLPQGAPLVIYGPFVEAGVPTAETNLAFDASLTARDPGWGLRDAGWLDELAAANSLVRTARHQMPANNLTLVWRRERHGA